MAAKKKKAPKKKALPKKAPAKPSKKAQKSSSKAKKSPIATLQTQPTAKSVATFLAAVDEPMRADCLKIAKWMEEISRESPKMWGPSIIGFGSQRLRYDSGRELDWMRIGFSPRRKAITLYLSARVLQPGLLARLGTHTTGKGCLYLKSLVEIDESVLKELITAALIADPAGSLA